MDAVIDGLAAGQYGVVGRRQLLQAGVSAAVVDRRLKRNRLRALHRGVYQVGPILPLHGRELAALVACGATAVLSHETAAVLRQLLPGGGVAVHVTTAQGDHSRRPGIRVHRVSSLPAGDWTRVLGLPVTTVTRTLFDLAAAADARTFEQALATALREALITAAALRSAVEGQPGRPGARRLIGLIGQEGGPAFTRSVAEDRFLALVRRAHLPAPLTNSRIGGYEVDFHWRAEQLVVEVDGLRFHASAARFESDRRRDAVLTAAGVRVMRVTWRQLENEPEAVLVRLAQAIARR